MIKVHSFESLGTHEGPGLRFVIFVQGCPFKCAYCHNPDTQKLNGGTSFSVKYLVDDVEKHKSFFGKKGGVTISGGEPLLQAKELIELFRELKEQGIHTAIDTCGAILNEDVKELLSLTDLVLLDIKHIDDKKHQKLVQASNKKTLEFIEYLEEIKKPSWIRYVLVPTLTDDENDLNKLGEYLKDFKQVERLEILPYHTFGHEKYEEMGIHNICDNIKAPSEEEVNKAKLILEKHINSVFIR